MPLLLPVFYFNTFVRPHYILKLVQVKASSGLNSSVSQLTAKTGAELESLSGPTIIATDLWLL